MKKILTVLLFVALFLFSNETNAQKLTPQQQKSLITLYKTKKVVHFKFKVNSMQEVKGMANIISVDKVKGTEVWHMQQKHSSQDFYHIIINIRLRLEGR